jgi:hypothetical protein
MKTYNNFLTHGYDGGTVGGPRDNTGAPGENTPGQPYPKRTNRDAEEQRQHYGGYGGVAGGAVPTTFGQEHIEEDLDDYEDQSAPQPASTPSAAPQDRRPPVRLRARDENGGVYKMDLWLPQGESSDNRRGGSAPAPIRRTMTTGDARLSPNERAGGGHNDVARLRLLQQQLDRHYGQRR